MTRMQLGLINYENVSTIVGTMAHKEEGSDTTGRSQENGGQMCNCLGCMWVGQRWGWRQGRGGAGGRAEVGLEAGQRWGWEEL